jgi:hypothetical protein
VPFSADLRALFGTWNGIDLEVLRIYGCAAEARLSRLSEEQEWLRNSGCEEPGLLVLGSSPAGFAYVQRRDGSVIQVDYKGWTEKKRLARDLDSFFTRYVFGAEAAEFGGEEWLEELRRRGLLGLQ